MSTRSAIVLTLLALLLFATLGSCSQQREADLDAQLLDDARRLRELDTELDRAVLTAQDGISPSYDELSTRIDELQRLLGQTERVALRISDPQVASAMRTSHDALTTKRGLVESFESRNSVVRNSVAYLERTRRVARPGESSDRAELTLATGLVLACVVATERTHDAAAGAELERAISGLAASEAHFTGPERAAAEAVLRHSWLYAREAPLLEHAVESLMNEENGRAFEELYRVAQVRLAHGARVGNVLRAALAVMAVLLLGLVSVVLGRLRQKRVELAALNQHLEQRVTVRTRDLEASREQYRALVESTQAIPWEMAPGTLHFAYVGPQATRLLGYAPHEWQEDGFLAKHLHPDDVEATLLALLESQATNDHEIELRMIAKDGRCLSLRSLVSSFRDERGRFIRRGILLDVTARRTLEAKLSTAQKLESVGRLAAGVAHEINTPVQFVSDNVHFTRNAFTALSELLGTLRGLVDDRSLTNDERIARAHAASESADVDYLVVEAPRAMESSADGLGRIASIVRSLKDFSHPDAPKMAPADLNKSLESTLTVARSEYQDVADLELDLAPLPPVVCHIGQINQVILNLTINAAHAIADVVSDGERGRITVRSACEDGQVVIAISDTGSGIPEHARGRLFDPFFTTKPLGRGTGQGLAIARSIVVEHHRGEITFETETGRGTTFYVRLPLASVGAAA